MDGRSTRNVRNKGIEEIQMDVTKVNKILVALTERQKTEPTLGKYGSEKGEGLVRLGSFKVSSAVLRALKKEFKELGDFQSPDAFLFKQQRKIIDDLERKEIAKLFAFGDSEEDWTKVQDFLAGQPKKAMQRFLMNAQKVSPKLAASMRKIPENVPLWFYMIMIRVGGEDLAKIIFGKHFMSEPYYAWKGKIEKKNKGRNESIDVYEVNELLELATEGLMGEAIKDSGLDESLKLDDSIYRKTEKWPKYNVEISPLSAHGSDCGKILRKRLPDWTKEQHLAAAKKWKAEADKTKKQYSKALDDAAQEAWGRPFRPTDYKIAGIGSSEFPEKTKDKLRFLATHESESRDAAYAHESAAKLRFEKKDESMDVYEVNELLESLSEDLSEAKNGSSKLQKLKAKYMDQKTGRFKGGKGKRFDNCVAYMTAKGGVDDPEALCGKIARSKGMAPGGSNFGK